MKYAVVSYWTREEESTALQLYDTYDNAKEALIRLWK